MKWQRYWKAIAGALAPGAVVIIASATGVSEEGSTITTSEWITALASIIISGGAVYIAPPNDYSTPAPATHTEPQPPPEHTEPQPPPAV